ncbi:hypothetical protein, partial [Megasphaera sp.]|uniref:hypothetical protein n=1 Tax=Megasphaera sp. TaxID=2023260 RepID=UPI00258F37E3
HLRSSPSNAWPDNGCLPAASTGKSAFGQQLLDDFSCPYSILPLSFQQVSVMAFPTLLLPFNTVLYLLL